MALERQVHAKIMSKRDPEREREVKEWIESVLGEKWPATATYEDHLKDGQVLCKVINKLQPGSVNKINSSGGQFKLMENITNFLSACEKYGVGTEDLFPTNALYEKKDTSAVTTCLFAVGRASYNSGWGGPFLGPKPAAENKREFSEDVIQAGKTVIGLQAGSNKGATQAGSNMGASRKILLGK